MNSLITHFFVQIQLFWQELKYLQKIGLISVLIVLSCLLGAFLFFPTSTTYVVLFPQERLQNNDLTDIKGYLDRSNIPYKLTDDKLWVPQYEEQRIRTDLIAYGLPKTQNSKGFELFDSNTWIKGEKELQILELRALKGQLENDLSHFENIRSANVILDIPPNRPFGGSNYKTKASVILNLMPGARLNSQELRAITFHISGAVRGLSPNMVAISDTQGTLYQALDPEGSYDSIRQAELAAEDNLKAKINALLATVVGFDHFFTSIQISMSRDKTLEERKIFNGTVEGINLGSPVVTFESSTSSSSPNQSSPTMKNNEDKNRASSSLPSPSQESTLFTSLNSKQMAVPTDQLKITTLPGKIISVSVSVLVDRAFLNSGTVNASNPSSANLIIENLKKDIENQLDNLLKGYGAQTHSTVNFVKFNHSVAPVKIIEPPVQVKETAPLTIFVGIITLGVLGILLLMFSIHFHSKRLTVLKHIQEGHHKRTLADLEEVLDKLKNRLTEPHFSDSRPEDQPLSTYQLLLQTDANQLIQFLNHESPQTLALLLYDLPRERSLTLFKTLNQTLQIEIILAMTTLYETNAQTFHSLMLAVSKLFGSSSTKENFNKVELFTTLLFLFHTLSTTAQQTLKESLALTSPELLEKLTAEKLT